MKKKLHFYLVLLLAPFTAFMLISNSSGANAGLTGSPGDNAAAPSGFPGNCTICHSGADTFTTYGLSTNITTNIPSGGYALGATYTITVTSTSSIATKHGFEITAEIANGSKVGTFVITDATNTQIKGTANDYVTHTLAGSDLKSWTFNWIAPSSDVGTITFYAAAIAGAGTGTVNTQMVMTSKVAGGVLGVNDARLLQFTMYPNPSDRLVTIQLPSGTNKAQATVFDYLGKSLIQKSLSNSENNLDISNLSSGIYFVRIQTDSKIGTKKLIVR